MLKDQDMDGPELLLRFDNQKPIRATAFARVLTALASDYRRIYNDELIIVAVEHGSLRARLRSLSEAAEQANHIIDFGKNLGGLFAAALLGAAVFAPSTPLSAAKALATLAMKSNSRLELKYVEPGKQELVINVEPKEAQQVLETLRAAPKTEPIWAHDLSLPLNPDRNTLTGPLPALPSGAAPQDFGLLKRQLVGFGSSAAGLDDLDPDVRKLIVALVLALNDAAPFRVIQLTHELEAEGHVGAASLVREITYRDPKDPMFALTGY